MAHEFFAATGTIILSHMLLSRCQHLLWLGNHDWVMTNRLVGCLCQMRAAQ